MSDLGVVYSFCVIECCNLFARTRAVALVSRLLHAGFTLSDTSHAMVQPPQALPTHHPGGLFTPQPLSRMIFTLVRQPGVPGSKAHYDQQVIDAMVAEAKEGVSEGQIIIDIA